MGLGSQHNIPATIWISLTSAWHATNGTMMELPRWMIVQIMRISKEAVNLFHITTRFVNTNSHCGFLRICLKMGINRWDFKSTISWIVGWRKIANGRQQKIKRVWNSCELLFKTTKKSRKSLVKKCEGRKMKSFGISIRVNEADWRISCCHGNVESCSNKNPQIE